MGLSNYTIQLLFSSLLFCGLLLMEACGRGVDSEQALKAYTLAEKNGLVKTKDIPPINLKVVYRPTDLVVAQQLRGQQASPRLIDSLSRQYGQFAYFLLSLSANDREIEAWNSRSHSQFSERLQTLAFGMRDYVQVVTSEQDTLPMVDYAYQRTFGAAASSDLLFAFDKDKMEQAKWVQFRLKDFGLGIGYNHFRFETNDLKATPTLTFNNDKSVTHEARVSLK